jgi:hypothetical protein
LLKKANRLEVLASARSDRTCDRGTGAGQGQAEQGGAGGVDAVDHGLDAELLRVDAALLVDLGVAVEAGGDALGRGWRGEEIAGQLFDHKLVEGLVAR